MHPDNSSQKPKVLSLTFSLSTTGQRDPSKITEQRSNSDPTAHLTAYVMRSGLRVLIMQSLWRDVLLFQSCGNFSFSGHSDSTNFFQRLGEPWTSLSRCLNSSMEHRDCHIWERKREREETVFKLQSSVHQHQSFWPLRKDFSAKALTLFAKIEREGEKKNRLLIFLLLI